MGRRFDERPEKVDIDKMLESAESLLFQDIEEELKLLERNPFADVNPEKYRRAKALFEKILSLDPKNPRAKEGLAACEEMIAPYYPVQYLVPPPTPEDLKDSQIKKDSMPWEVRRMMREQDRRGLEYTAKVFSEADAKARKEAFDMVKEAKDEVENLGRDPAKVYMETSEGLRALQERLHHAWKGHGPEILSLSIKALKEALGLENNSYLA